MFYKMLFDRFVDFSLKFLYTVLDMPEQIRIVCLKHDAVLRFVNSSKAIAWCPKHSTEPGLPVQCFLVISLLANNVVEWLVKDIWLVATVIRVQIILSEFLLKSGRGLSLYWTAVGAWSVVIRYGLSRWWTTVVWYDLALHQELSTFYSSQYKPRSQWSV